MTSIHAWITPWSNNREKPYITWVFEEVWSPEFGIIGSADCFIWNRPSLQIVPLSWFDFFLFCYHLGPTSQPLILIFGSLAHLFVPVVSIWHHFTHPFRFSSLTFPFCYSLSGCVVEVRRLAPFYLWFFKFVRVWSIIFVLTCDIAFICCLLFHLVFLFDISLCVGFPGVSSFPLYSY
jgi:hypothetical protein